MRYSNSLLFPGLEYLTADAEENYVIAQANAPLDDKSRFRNDTVQSRPIG